MKRQARIPYWLLLSVIAVGPFVLGYLVARMPYLWRLSPALWGWAFLAAWFLAGRHLGRTALRTAGLIAGVVPPAMGAGLFIQQFYLAAGEQMSQTLSLVGQLYPMIAVSPSSWVIRTLGVTSIDSRAVVLTGYGMVVGVFVLGFILGRQVRR